MEQINKTVDEAYVTHTEKVEKIHNVLTQIQGTLNVVLSGDIYDVRPADMHELLSVLLELVDKLIDLNQSL